jgi:hypothetical protein
MIRRPLEKILVQALVLTAIGGLYGHTMAQDSPFDQPTANEVDNPFSETNNNTADSPTSTDGETVNDPFASTTQPSDSPFAPTFGEDNSTGNTPAANAVDNPFASAGTGSTPAAPDSPFGEETAGATDPFGGNAAAAPDSPFGGNNAGAGNPFGGTADGATDPFGGPPATPPLGTPELATGTTSDPFGGSTTSDPFGGSIDPFSGSFGGDQPTGTMGTGAGITNLYEFRYKKIRRWDQSEVVARQRMTKEEAASFDTKVLTFFQELADNDELPGFSVGVNDSEEWAQWMLYANQLELWSEYCTTIVLIGAEVIFDPEVDIMWPGDPQDDEEEDTGRAKAPDNIYNENRSLDDQLADFNPLPDTRSGSQGNQVIDPEQMNIQAAGIYRDFLISLRDQEEFQRLYMVQLKNDLDRREQRREAYAEWRESLKLQLKDYVEEWARRYDGKIVNIAGVRYELYKPGEVPEKVHRDAHIVETEYGLTPYDLLNEDGTIRLSD